jgi:RecA/RadA recombinase
VERIDLDFVSDTIQDWYRNVFSVIREGRPFIYVLDSFDSLTSEEEVDRANKDVKGKGNETGSYKTEKPKLASEILRVTASQIRKMEAFILIVSQTRDNIGFGAMFQPKVRSGGKALKFYSSHEIWLAMDKQEKKKGRVIGNKVMAKVTKNKLTGKRRTANFPIYYDYGVDDLTSMINFLVEEGYWKKNGNKIVAHDFNIEGLKPTLIKSIEQNKMEEDLRSLVGSLWNDIEDSLRLERKGRFD